MKTDNLNDELNDIETFFTLFLAGDKLALTNFVHKKPLIYKKIMDLMSFGNNIGTNTDPDRYIKDNSEFLSQNIEGISLIFKFLKEFSQKSKKNSSQNNMALFDKGVVAMKTLSTIVHSRGFVEIKNPIGAILTLADAHNHMKSYNEQGKLTLNECIIGYEKLLTRPEFAASDLGLRTQIYYEAGTSYLARYKNQGILSDLDLSIRLLEKAVSINPTENNFPNLYHDLGAALREKYTYTQNTQEIIRSVELMQKASQMPQISSEMKLLYLSNILEIAFSCPQFYTDKQIINFILLYEFMFSILHEKITDIHLNILARGYFTLFQRMKENQHIDKSINNFEKAISMTDDNKPVLPNYINNLAAAFYARYDIFNNNNDLDDAIIHYKKSLEAGISRGLQISTALKSSRALCYLTFSHQAWQEVTEAFGYARQATEKLLKTQATRSDKEAWLKDMQGIVAQAAYAFAQLGKPEQAALALEQGSARLLSEALALNYAEIEALQDRPELYQAYHAALTAYQNAQHIQIPAEQQRAMRATWQELDTVIEKIRQVPGFEDFLQPAQLAEIEQAAAEPLLYLAATAQGRVGILVQREDTVARFTTLFFPQLTDEALRNRLDKYLAAYRGRHQDSYARRRWQAHLEGVCAWLGEVFLSPLSASGCENLTLIPLGLLSLLPLHAASDGKRYALDTLCLRYAPNARSLNRARAIQADSDRLLVACNPHRDLQYSELEAALAQQFIPKRRVFYHQEVLIETLKTHLPHYNVLHFACHGETNPEKPLESGLHLADGKLTLDMVLKTRLNARLVILSACETGMLADLQRAEEFVSLATGLLQAGSAAVIASLWAVDDRSTMILLSHFYALWQKQHLAPAAALRQAQIWLRDSTPAQRSAFFRELLPEAEVAKLEDVWACDFSHPYHWAGFGVVGES